MSILRDDNEFAALLNALSGDSSCYDYALKVLDKPEIATYFSLQAKRTIQNTVGTNNLCPHGLDPGKCWFCAGKIDENLSFLVGEIAKVREQELKDLLGRKKLYLVLDLDHTLLHSIRLHKLTAEEKFLCTQTENLPDSLRCGLYRLDRMNLLTKLRPFVHSFLKEANDLFEMHICTRGDRRYALEIAKLLDPDNVYFNNYSRVIAREDQPKGNKKSLNFLSGKENAVVILDDKEEVWEKDRPNLIVVERYNYFAASLKRDKKDENARSYSLMKTDESESSGQLAKALNVLRGIHAEFFNLADQNNGLVHQDVRQVMSVMFDEIDLENISWCC